jgi:alpha-galactosidase
MPYWQGKGVLPDAPSPIKVFDADERKLNHDAMWVEVDEYISGKKSMELFRLAYRSDHAIDVIAAMWSGSKQPFYINTANNGAVTNLPDDSFLELLCDVSMDGPVPRHAGAFPLGLRSLQMQVLDTHELTVEATVKSDRELLRRAMLADPIVNSASDADAIINELLQAQREVLSPDWY